MRITAGGKEYQVAPLKLVDVRDLSRAGVLARMRRLGELDLFEQLEATAELLAVAVRRAGGDLSAQQLLEAADGTELAALTAAVPEILAASGFIGGRGGQDPNAEGPRAETPT